MTTKTTLKPWCIKCGLCRYRWMGSSKYNRTHRTEWFKCPSCGDTAYESVPISEPRSEAELEVRYPGKLGADF